MTWVMGIDPSLTGFAVCVAESPTDFKTERWTSHFLGTGIAARIDRMLPLVENVMEVVDKYNPSVICIEGYSFGSNVSGVTERVELGGILRADLVNDNRAALYEVAPTTLKKFCTGTGKGDKVAMIACMTKRWGVEFFDSDRYDAYGLTRMALCLAELVEPESDAQRQAIESVLRGPKAKGVKRHGRS